MRLRKRTLIASCACIVALTPLVHAQTPPADNTEQSQDTCAQTTYRGVAPKISNPKTSKQIQILCSGFYSVGYFGPTKTPLWSAEHLTTASVEAGSKFGRPDSNAFQPDTRIPEPNRSQLADYKGSVKLGYDRGHMTPSEDAPTESMRVKTFLLSNIVPQASVMNRGVWAGIEKQVREITKHVGDLYVVTGPAYIGSNFRWIGPDHVLVPSSTWKAVYIPSLHASGVYVCSNNTQKPLCSIVSASQLTAATGIDPFPSTEIAEKNNRLKLPQPIYHGDLEKTTSPSNAQQTAPKN